MRHTLRPVPSSPFNSIEAALEDIRAGKMVVVCDAEDRQNEGDLTIAAEFASPEAVNFMVTHAGGLVCLALTAERCERLRLSPMVADNESPYQTAFTVSIEARDGIDTGISAYDRARTIEVAIDALSGPSELVCPGHMFPLRARPGGVLERTGHTEAAVDLARLAGLYPAGVICQVMNPDGTMARVPDLERYCAEHGLKMVAISDVVAYRRRHERFVQRNGETTMPTRFGSFRAVTYRSGSDGKEHVALVNGEIRGLEDVLVRLHSECLAGDVFGSLRCDCGLQFEHAVRRVVAEGRGVVVYLAREKRGLGVPVESHHYGIAAEILADLGVRSVRLLTGNPSKIAGLEEHSIRVSGQVPVEHAPAAHTPEYLRHELGRTA
jgi:3,4-dihydroxy 2-butanone 4-phosphate synthase / GTP cyclohydrolase II